MSEMRNGHGRKNNHIRFKVYLMALIMLLSIKRNPPEAGLFDALFTNFLLVRSVEPVADTAQRPLAGG